MEDFNLLFKELVNGNDKIDAEIISNDLLFEALDLNKSQKLE